MRRRCRSRFDWILWKSPSGGVAWWRFHRHATAARSRPERSSALGVAQIYKPASGRLLNRRTGWKGRLPRLERHRSGLCRFWGRDEACAVATWQDTPANFARNSTRARAVGFRQRILRAVRSVDLYRDRSRNMYKENGRVESISGQSHLLSDFPLSRDFCKDGP